MLESDRGGVIPTTSLKRNGRTDNLTRSSKKNKSIHLTRSMAENKTVYNGEETTGLLISDDLYADSKQGVWRELSEEVTSKLSKSVVSLSLIDGHTVLFACSGVVARSVKHATRFLTSANFVEVLNEKRKDHDNLKVQVRHGDNVEIGVLGEYDLDKNIACVHTKNIPSLQPVILKNLMGFPPDTKVVSIGMDISGKLIGTRGMLNDDPSASECCGKLTLSKFSMVCNGGPLFDLDGKFAGMNIFLGTERTFFMSTYKALMWLAVYAPR
ncbi:hypothetical protein QOZ80_1BG0097150 [Eleusine coracana subsp. coracana]|nr:hypothetical protein QOZ80_1BG0097150 [Eleusine coracana subsp. coracana]